MYSSQIPARLNIEQQSPSNLCTVCTWGLKCKQYLERRKKEENKVASGFGLHLHPLPFDSSTSKSDVINPQSNWICLKIPYIGLRQVLLELWKTSASPYWCLQASLISPSRAAASPDLMNTKISLWPTSRGFFPTATHIFHRLHQLYISQGSHLQMTLPF